MTSYHREMNKCLTRQNKTVNLLYNLTGCGRFYLQPVKQNIIYISRALFSDKKYYLPEHY